MALPCGVCEQPVHDHAVICPHCGEPTGIAPDSKLSTAEVSALLATDPDATIVPAVDPARIAADFLPVSPFGAGAAVAIGAAAVVGAAVGAVVDTLRDARDKPELPTAIAHIRRRHVTPVASTEPEDVETPADGEEPRFLK